MTDDTRRLKWNGAGVYVSDKDPLCVVDTKDERGRYVFFHVCCSCRMVHEVRVKDEGNRLSMEWLNDLDAGAVREIQTQIDVDGE
jgi:uncharacterized protein (UPF0218 family)